MLERSNRFVAMVTAIAKLRTTEKTVFSSHFHPERMAILAQRAKKVKVRFKPLLAMLFTPGRDTCNFAHIGLKALLQKSLKVYYWTA
jgi:hypothetical protein